MTTVLAVSPHLDDAAFSGGGALHRLAQEGWRVVVATVFTRSVPDPRGFALACQLDKGLAADVDYMALRRDEDAAACAALGAAPRWLPFPEAPHRGYGSAPALFGPALEGDDIAAPVAAALADLLREVRPALILAPQAIGAHVDHRMVVDALDRIRPEIEVAWWRDYPYSVREAAPRQPFADRFRALEGRRVDLTAESRAAKLRACLAYESQIGYQFGDAAALADGLRGEVGEGFAVAGPTPPELFGPGDGQAARDS